MKSLIASILVLGSASLFGFGDDRPPARATSKQSAPLTTTSAPTTTTAAKTHFEKKIGRLIHQLGDRDFHRRENAQKELADIGEIALPQIAAALGHENPEIAHRLKALLKRPDDPVLRIATVERLIASANPDWIESGVYMLFRDPIADADAFREITNRATGIERAMFEPVAEQLEQWKQITELHLRRQKELLKRNPEAAATERKMQADTIYYQAEAAYWQAVEAAETFREEQGHPGSNDQRGTSRAASQPAKK